MADQLVFDGSLSLAGINPGVAVLGGTVDVTYGVTDTVTGSLSLAVVGLPLQTYTNLEVTENGTTGVYTLTGSSLLTNISITYTGQAPITSSVSVNLLSTGLPLASGTASVTSTPICFAHGTHILTDRGEFLIENLKVGDSVVTPHGPQASAQIRWIGRQHFEGDAARFTQPVLVRAGALGEGLPHRDLRVSSDHCLHLDGRLVPAKLLVNGASIVFDRGHEMLDYVNIELDQHSVILAEGIESESYLDCGNRFRFDNADEGADWVASRPVGSDAAWHDGRAFTQPLWDGPELASLVERIGAFSAEMQAKAA